MLTLTPQARAISAITVAFMLVTGSLDHLGVAVIGVFGTDVTTRTHAQLILVVMLVVAVLVLLFARSTSNAADGWAQATAQAASLLSVLALAIIVLNLVGSVLHNSPSGYLPYFAG